MKTLAILCTLAAASGGVQAANFLVTNNNDSGVGSFRQAIINANADIDGPHSISFSGGLYPNGSAIVLQSSLPTITVTDLYITGGAANPVIDGDDAYRPLYAATSVHRLHLKDLELRNGYATQTPGQGGGCLGSAGGSAGDLVLENVIFRDCTLEATSLAWGAALSWSRSTGSVDIQDSRFIGNHAEITQADSGQGGGGALSLWVAHADIQRSWFENNSTVAETGTADAGAVYLVGAALQTVWLSDSTFIGNAASPGRPKGGKGGALYIGCADCFVQIERNWFRGNTGNSGGAMYFRQTSASTNDARMLLYNNAFYNHLVSGSGGALFAGDDFELDAVNNSFYNNSAAEGAHIAFNPVTNTSVVLGFRANLLAPVATGTACSGTPSRPTPSAIRLNLFADGGCDILDNEELPTADVGSFQLEESGFGEDMSYFWFDGSSVIDAITDISACDDMDILGNARPIDGDADMVADCDVGAFEKYWVLGPPIDTLIFTDGFEN